MNNKNNKYRFPVISTGNHYVNNENNTTSDYQNKSIETVAKTLSFISRPKSPLDNLDKSYNRENIYPNYIDTQKDYDKARADSQSALEQATNSAIQLVGNEIVLGMALGLSNLVDFGVNVFKEEGEDDYTNPVSSTLENWQEQIRDRFAIYREDPNATFAIGDFAWWADNFVSVGSTLSLMLPSMGVTAGLSKLVKIRGIGRKISRGLAKASMLKKINGTNDLRGLASRIKSIEEGSKIGTTALLSRTMENYQEARGVYNIAQENTLKTLDNFSEEERNEFIKNNPEFEGKDNKTIANIIAQRSADKTFKNDYAMLLFDMMQFKAISGLNKTGLPKKNTLNSARVRIENRNAAKKLLGYTEDQLEKNNIISRQKEALRYAFLNPGKTLYNTALGLEVTEGIEEGYQGIQAEKGEEVYKSYLDKNFAKRDLVSYLSDPAIYEQAVWGMVGAKVFKWAGNKYNALKDYAKYKKYKDKLIKDSDFNWLMSSEEKIKTSEIQDRQRLAEEFRDKIQLIEKGKNPYSPVLDDKGSPVKEEGTTKYEELDNDTKDIIKARAIDDFVTEMTLNAVDAGNYDLLKEYLTSTELNKFYKDAGVNVTPGDQSLSDMLIQRMDKIYKDYTDNLYTVMNNAPTLDNEYAIKLLARDITRDKLVLESIKDKVNSLRREIETDENHKGLNHAFYKSQLLFNIRYKINQLNNQKNELLDRFNKNKLSKSQYDREIINIDKKINNLYNLASIPDYTFDTTTGDEKHYSKLERYNLLNEEYKKYDINNISLPEQTTQNLINAEVGLQIAAKLKQVTIPETQEEYKDSYNEVTERIDKLYILKLIESLDKINNWLDTQDNLTEAKNKIYKEDESLSKELKEAIQILKLGSENTFEFQQQLEEHILELESKRKNKIEQDRTTSNNGEINNQIQEKSDEEKQNEEINNKYSKLNNLKKYNLNKLKSSVRKEDKKYYLDRINQNIADGAVFTEEELNFIDSAKQELNEQEQQTTNFPFTGEVSKPIMEDTTVIIDSETIPKEVQEKAIALHGGDNYKKESDDVAYMRERLVSIIKRYIIKLNNNPKSILFDESFTDSSHKNYTTLVNDIKRELKEEQIPNSFINEQAESTLKTFIIAIARSAKAKSNFNEYKRIIGIANSIVIKNKILNTDYESDIKFSNNILYSNLNELVDYVETVNSLFKDFLKDYEEDGVIPENARIDINDFFDYLIYNEKLQNDELSYIFNTLIYTKNELNVSLLNSDNLELYKNNPELFFQKVKDIRQQKERLSSNFHMNQDKNSDYLNNANLGDKFTVRSKGNSIEAIHNGKVVAYIGKVEKSVDYVKLRLKSKDHGGFIYEVWKDAAGNIKSNVDDIFNFILSNKSEAKEIFDILRDLNNGKNLVKHKNDKQKVLEVLQKHGLKIGENFRYKDGISDGEELDNLIYYINSILFYNKGDISKIARKLSVGNWIKRKYNNYVETAKIQDLLADRERTGNDVILTLNYVSGELVYNSDNKNVKDSGLKAEINPIVAVDNAGNIITESKTVDGYSNPANFKIGTMGMLVQDNPNAPLIALFTKANTLTDSGSKLKKMVKTELANLIKDYQSNKITFNELYTKLSQLISVGNENLFSGLNVIKHNDTIYINVAGDRNKYIAKIYSKNKEKDKDSVIIDYFKKANLNAINRFDSKSQAYDKIINNLTEDIINNLSFNRTFYFINNKNAKNKNDKIYIGKKNGKIVINIGGETLTYNSFGEFVMDNNAFKTNTYKDEKTNSLFSIPKEGNQAVFVSVDTAPQVKGLIQSDRVVNYIEQNELGLKTKVTSDALFRAGETQERINQLLGKADGYPIPLIPETFEYDENLDANGAYYKDGDKIVLGKKGLNKIKEKPGRIVKYLMHENLHKQFENNGLRNRKQITKGLIETYNDFIKYLNNDNSDIAKKLKEWIDKNKFNPTDYIKTAFPNNNFTSEEKEQIFAEEWLVESLTVPELTNYLNEAILKDKAVIVDNIEESNKSIFQKIIDLLLKLFGISSKNIKNNSILAEQYRLLSNDIDTTTDVQIETQTETKEQTETQTTSEETEPTLKRRDRRERQRRLSILEEVDGYTKFDDIRYSVLEEIENVNTSGITVVPDMSKYLESFSAKDRLDIAANIELGMITFKCS